MRCYTVLYRFCQVRYLAILSNITLEDLITTAHRYIIKHFIRGQAKMKTRMGLALAVMMAMALGYVKAGRIEQMRSLVQPIPIRKTG